MTLTNFIENQKYKQTILLKLIFTEAKRKPAKKLTPKTYPFEINFNMF